MSWNPQTVTEPIARKDYHCNACDWLDTYLNGGIFSFAEYRLIVKAKRDGWRIKAGQRYVKVEGKWDGEWSIFRARPEINEICQKHSIYAE